MAEGSALVRNYGVSGADYLQMLSSTVFAAPAYQGYGALIAAEKGPPGFPAGAGAEGRRAGAGRRPTAIRRDAVRRGVERQSSSTRWRRGMRIWTGPCWPRWRRGGGLNNERGLRPRFPFSEHDVRRRRRKQSFRTSIINSVVGMAARREDKWRQHTGCAGGKYGRRLLTQPVHQIVPAVRRVRQLPPAVNTGLAQNRFTDRRTAAAEPCERYAVEDDDKI